MRLGFADARTSSAKRMRSSGRRRTPRREPEGLDRWEQAAREWREAVGTFYTNLLGRDVQDLRVGDRPAIDLAIAFLECGSLGIPFWLHEGNDPSYLKLRELDAAHAAQSP